MIFFQFPNKISSIIKYAVTLIITLIITKIYEFFGYPFPQFCVYIK